jgi:hypothetical protein
MAIKLGSRKTENAGCASVNEPGRGWGACGPRRTRTHLARGPNVTQLRREMLSHARRLWPCRMKAVRPAAEIEASWLMNDLTTGAHIGSEAACRRLAVRVIHQAFRDLSGAAGSRADRDSARDFLSGSPMLYRWCDLADLEPASMIVRAARLVAQSGQLAATTAIQYGRSIKQSRVRHRRSVLITRTGVGGV